MAYVITGKCLGERYGACVSACPCGSMRYGDIDGRSMMVIDPNACIDCGGCLPECPVSAIVDSESQSPQWAEFNRAAALTWPAADADPEAWGPRDPADPPRNS